MTVTVEIKQNMKSVETLGRSAVDLALPAAIRTAVKSVSGFGRDHIRSGEINGRREGRHSAAWTATTAGGR
jgi:hypothetical protein